MTPPEDDALAVALEVLDALLAAGIPCALGGAHALGLWGVPRGTTDADIGTFVGAEDHARLVDALIGAGVTLERERALDQAREGDTIVGWRRGFRVDVFVPSIPFHDDLARTVRQVRVQGRDLPVISPESLAVLKLLFFRAKDLVDLTMLVQAQGARLDHAWVRGWVVRMVGEDDERVREWDRIVAVHAPREEGA
ncbi:MAG: hypothetical protein AB7N76_28855 [Planctomycetota bacterium]